MFRNGYLKTTRKYRFKEYDIPNHNGIGFLDYNLFRVRDVQNKTLFRRQIKSVSIDLKQFP